MNEGDVFSFSRDGESATWGTYHRGLFMRHQDTADEIRKRVELHAPEELRRFDKERAQCALFGKKEARS